MDRQRIRTFAFGEEARQRFAPFVALVMPVPLLVLAIACVNAVNLLLARGSVREREIAVRLSIGASRRRVVRQLLIESLLLSGVSAALAVPLVVTGLRLAENGLRTSMPLDGTVMSLGLVTVVASAVAFGLKPALQATGRPPASSLSHSHASDITPRQSGARRTLVIAQVALSLGLLGMGSQLLAAIRSTDRAAGTDPDRLLMASFDLRQVNMAPDEAARFYSVLLQRVSARREVAAAGIAPPRAIWTFRKGTQEDNALIAEYPPYGPRDYVIAVGGYAGGDLFDALGLRVVSGRPFTAEDRQDGRPRVAIVNQEFVDRNLHGVALGRTINIAPWEKGTRAFGALIPVQVVGVVESASERAYSRTGNGATPSLYVPTALVPDPVLTLYAKSSTSAHAIIPIVRDLVHEIDPRVAITDIGSLSDVNKTAMAPYIAMARAGTLLGVIALLLAAWGLYAVMSHVVAMRSREFAIRMALGAEARAVLTMVASQAGWLAGIGAGVGTVSAIVIGYAIQAEMHGTTSASFIALLTSAAILVTAMLVASLVPAMRASRANPITLLKDA
jgi:predicted permease